MWLYLCQDLCRDRECRVYILPEAAMLGDGRGGKDTDEEGVKEVDEEMWRGREEEEWRIMKEKQDSIKVEEVI